MMAGGMEARDYLGARGTTGARRRSLRADHVLLGSPAPILRLGSRLRSESRRKMLGFVSADGHMLPTDVEEQPAERPGDCPFLLAWCWHGPCVSNERLTGMRLSEPICACNENRTGRGLPASPVDAKKVPLGSLRTVNALLEGS
jgi:hypothetical protein